jgi:hypothetical protein
MAILGLVGQSVCGTGYKIRQVVTTGYIRRAYFSWPRVPLQTRSGTGSGRARS